MKKKQIPFFFKILASEMFAQIGRFNNTGFENSNNVLRHAVVSDWDCHRRTFERFRHYRL